MQLTIRSALAALALCSVGASAAAAPPSDAGLSYVLTNAKLSLSTVDGSSRLSQSFSTAPDYSLNAPPFDLAAPTQLENDDVIRLGFSLGVQEGSGKGEAKFSKEHLPHQAFVVLAEAGKASAVSNAAQTAWPIQVKPSSGKASWNLRMDRIPSHLLEAEGPLVLSLLISNFPASSAATGSYQPLSLPLISLRLPSSLQSASAAPSAREKAEIEQGFRGWPYNFHTFGSSPADSMPSRKLSLVASVVTVAVPWIVLLGLIATVQPSLSAPTARISLLFVSLVGLEALAIRYWIGITLFQMLPFLAGGGLVTLIIGKSALGDLRRQRLVKAAAAK
ncbi:uncharacterized protein PFL1_06521 [Pseudozyma flocculosa PF-1]|uniref:Ribophorin II C-terminal domain-containing protein n=2 Tax=Pseudozyma flocculosa TaxID=84751 RepID=A0A5C3F992_9BASI|nr:uncharacterized protein PFL1_06521 [Pseudozyma flocculosa PF-1]EPQ25846.1 hypothetical protein PFL1_06521 [Pseudozyma flocculosa PF-1]SPO40656.1 uncharacterized protein PSFLO_06138 [Pseudozyma flocculosa]